jgi:hypothetical protein
MAVPLLQKLLFNPVVFQVTVTLEVKFLLMVWGALVSLG